MDKLKIILKREGDVGLLEINNPPENYLEKPDFIEIDRLKNYLDTGIKALVISGTGRNFSAGANLESVKDQIKEVNSFQDQIENGNRILNYLDQLNIPVIASISGVCFGAGLEIALACDIRICEKNALFAFPEVNHNLFPGLGGVRRLTELTGKPTALQLVLNGDLINADKAFELNIIDQIAEKKQALENAITLAKKITNNRPLKVINAVMKSIHNSKILDIDEMIKEDAKLFSDLAVDTLRSDEN